MEVTGTTTVYAIAADPIAQVKTPQRINQLLLQQHADAIMVPFHVGADGLASLFSGLRAMRNLGGVVVSVPHKERVPALCDELTAAAQLAGAVNAVRRQDGRLIGANFDGLGFVAGLRAQGVDVAGRRIYLAGLGGAGKAISFALAEAGAASLHLYNRSTDKATACASRLREHYPAVAIEIAGDAPGQCDIAINATSLGMRDSDPLPFRLDGLAGSTVVADVVMAGADTPVLRAAAAKGCRTHGGRHMLEGQLVEIARFLGMGNAAGCGLPAHSVRQP